MTGGTTMQAELASVLADPTFMRSPVLARLLGFLVETTLSGRGRGLKSYSVAVDGLGRSPDLDPQVDTYARVQVARLRKALDGFYATAGAEHSHRLAIETGSYEVQLANNGPARPQTPTEPETPPEPALAPEPAPVAWYGRPMVRAALLLLLVVAVGALAYWWTSSQAQLDRWRTGNFPSATLSVFDKTEGHAGREDAELIRQELLTRMSRYQGVHISYGASAKSDYTVNVYLYALGNDLLAKTFVLRGPERRLVWSSSEPMKIDPADPDFLNNAFISRISFVLAEPTGVIHSYERRRDYALDTPYGCWLRFTEELQSQHTLNDRSLQHCAADWYDAVPSHPIATAIYGWTMVDASIYQSSEAGRRAKLAAGLEMLERERMLYPNAGLVQVALMRGYAFQGQDAAMRIAGNEALRLNPGNLNVQGMVGAMFIMRNDPRGESLIDDAIAQRSANPPPWYFSAKFIAAMMRDDSAGAGRALSQLQALNNSQAAIPIFTAAYQARSGQMDKARVNWKRAQVEQATLRLDPERFFQRMPLAPAVADRLKLWLKPVSG